jgi:diguanylate cyclase (GGDEF)-like protein
MSAPPVNYGSTPLQEPAAASHLQGGGHRRLRFNEAILEHSFRQDHWRNSRLGVHLHVWLAIALVISFIVIDELVLLRAASVELLVIRAVAIFTLGVCVAVTSARMARICSYHRIIQFLAPVFGLCVVANELINVPQSTSFFPAIVLSVFGLYMLMGMLFTPALLSGLFVLAIYMIGAVLVRIPEQELVYNGTILLFSNVLGGAACYRLEHLRRRAFLEARLLRDMANRDGLTGIHNRRAFDEHLNRLWQQAIRDQQSMALLLVDIDYFKAYNDYYGHQAGDQCLRQVAHILTQACRRPMDFTARYGGEEFAVVLYDVRREYVQELAANIHAELHRLALNHPASPDTRQLTVSIGAACVTPVQDRSIFGFVQLADEALYEAKDTGRDRTVIKDEEYSDLTTGAFRHPQHQARRLVS